MSHRRQQLESTLQRVISQVISAGLADPRVGGLISVTGVKVTPDGQQAIIGISVLPEERQTTVLHGLRHATRHIHAAASEKIRTRSLPKFRFELDTSLKKQAAVLDAIRQAADEDFSPSKGEVGRGIQQADDDPTAGDRSPDENPSPNPSLRGRGASGPPPESDDSEGSSPSESEDSDT